MLSAGGPGTGMTWTSSNKSSSGVGAECALANGDDTAIGDETRMRRALC